MREQFARTQLLLGEANMERLSRARVAVFGIGTGPQRNRHAGSD